MALEPAIEAEARQLQRVLKRHRVPAVVEGAGADGDGVTFFVRARRSEETWQVRVLADELAHAVGRPLVELDQHPPLVVLRMGPRPRPVFLADIWEEVIATPPGTVVLGKTIEGRPLHVNLMPRHLVPMLISGGARAGKSALLRLIGLQVALTTSPRTWRLVVVPGLRPSLVEALRTLPHVWCPPEDLHHRHPLLALSALLAEWRPADRRIRLLVLVDDLEDVLAVTGRAGRRALSWLLDEGPSAGVRTVLVSRRVHLLPSDVIAKCVVHLSGRPDPGGPLPTEYDDLPETMCPRWPGQFLLCTPGGVHLVRVAWVGSALLRRLATWHRRRRPVVYARSLLATHSTTARGAETAPTWDPEPEIPELRFNGEG
ncbi:MAG: hypothetical protein Q9O62_14945 [Ardenticatenia bacterium]|nr:hypothetical protein [Ardenticatenia bacterium]